MLAKLLEIIGYSAISGTLYFLGGQKGYNTKIRDLGCPSVFLIAMWRLGAFSGLPEAIGLIISALLMFPALTTYHKWLNKLFGKSKDDCYWFNWIAHSIGIGLSLLPYILVIHKFIGWIAYISTLTFLMTWWSEKISSAFWEQWGRGFLIIFFLWFFLI